MLYSGLGVQLKYPYICQIRKAKFKSDDSGETEELMFDHCTEPVDCPAAEMYDLRPITSKYKTAYFLADCNRGPEIVPAESKFDRFYDFGRGGRDFLLGTGRFSGYGSSFIWDVNDRPSECGSWASTFDWHSRGSRHDTRYFSFGIRLEDLFGDYSQKNITISFNYKLLTKTYDINRYRSLGVSIAADGNRGIISDWLTDQACVGDWCRFDRTIFMPNHTTWYHNSGRLNMQFKSNIDVDIRFNNWQITVHD